MAAASVTTSKQVHRDAVSPVNDDDNDQQASNLMADNFCRDFEQFKRQFDRLAADDSFMGKRLERSAKQVQSRHCKLISRCLSDWRIDNKTNERHLLEDDLKIIEQQQQPTSGDASSSSPLRPLVAGLFWRLAQATYLRVTFNKSRQNCDDDRLEPVHFARQAIRLEPNNFDCLYWFMISK